VIPFPFFSRLFREKPNSVQAPTPPPPPPPPPPHPPPPTTPLFYVSGKIEPCLGGAPRPLVEDPFISRLLSLDRHGATPIGSVLCVAFPTLSFFLLLESTFPHPRRPIGSALPRERSCVRVFSLLRVVPPLLLRQGLDSSFLRASWKESGRGFRRDAARIHFPPLR